MSNTESFNKPFFIPFRAMLGDFDFQVVYDTLGDDVSPGQNYMVLFGIALIWLYVYFSTIVIINLMIAKMYFFFPAEGTPTLLCGGFFWWGCWWWF